MSFFFLLFKYSSCSEVFLLYLLFSFLSVSNILSGISVLSSFFKVFTIIYYITKNIIKNKIIIIAFFLKIFLFVRLFYSLQLVFCLAILLSSSKFQYSSILGGGASTVTVACTLSLFVLYYNTNSFVSLSIPLDLPNCASICLVYSDSTLIVCWVMRLHRLCTTNIGYSPRCYQVSPLSFYTM